MSHSDPHSLLDKLYLSHPWFYGYEYIQDIKSFNLNALFRAKDYGDTSKPKAWVALGRSCLGFLSPISTPCSPGLLLSRPSCVGIFKNSINLLPKNFRVHRVCDGMALIAWKTTSLPFYWWLIKMEAEQSYVA